MLTDLKLHNYKNHVDTTLTGLKPLSVLVGPNAVGKSSVLEAARHLHRLGLTAPQETVRGSLASGADAFIRSGASELRLEARGSSKRGPWSITLALPRGEPGETHVSLGDQSSRVTTVNYRREPRWFDGVICPATYLRLEGSELRRPSYQQHPLPSLQTNGYGLATAVSYLMRTDPKAYSELTTRLCDVVPSVLGLRTNPVEIPRSQQRLLQVEGKSIPYETKDSVYGDELVFDTVDGLGIPGSAQSEGTLIVLGLLTALSMPDRPELLLLDDIETGLHPTAQRKLVGVLRHLTEQSPSLQLLMTTHSPYILDELEPDEVWVLGRSAKDKPPVAKRLADHPRASELEPLFTTGELWGIDDEGWVGKETP